MANHFWPRNPLRSKRRRTRRREQGWRTAARGAEEKLVLSHGNCLDGITSAVIVRRACTGVATAYAQPSQVLAALRTIADVPGQGRALIIADLSMQTRDHDAIVKALHAVKEAGWKASWYDHHHKQWEGLELAGLKAVLERLVVDHKQKESGATLVQKAFAPKDKALRRLAETVRDRDLWWNKTPDSETLEFALNDLGARRMEEHLTNHPLDGPIIDGTLAAAAHRERASQAAQAGKVLATTRYYGEATGRVGVVYGWLPRNTGLHTLIEEHGCAVAINVRPNGKMSIRSRKGADVSHIIAGAFGGGGHPNASGGDLGLKGPKYWWYVVRKGKVPITRAVAEKAVQELEA